MLHVVRVYANHIGNLGAIKKFILSFEKINVCVDQLMNELTVCSSDPISNISIGLYSLHFTAPLCTIYVFHIYMSITYVWLFERRD